jgi:uncharacterized membrane protein YphA (DoxX/SURF4 family)
MNLRLSADLWFTYLVAMLEALLCARLVLQLFAARPTNVVVASVLTVTNLLQAPFAFLDRGQPRFGAVLEFSTLTLCLVIPIIWIFAQRLFRRTPPSPRQ